MDIEITTGLCRCCYSEGSSKDLISTHHWMGTPEVYSQMLKECFDIELSNLDSNSNNICEVCVTQLRNASNFKKQVLQTESVFQKHLKSQAVKVETKLEDAEDAIEDYLGDDGAVDDAQSDYEMPIKNESVEEVSTKKRKAPASKKTKKKAKTEKAETSTKSTDDARDGDDKKKPRKRRNREGDSATPERLEHRVNLTAILKYSNASPFRDKRVKGFSCLYCCKYFKDINDLRDHTSQKVEKDKINKMIDYKLSYNPIKIDITDLQCTLCDMEMSDLNDLKEHLGSVHNKVLYKNIKDIILPFRLEDGCCYKCVICSVEHISFKNLYHHMSSHYSNYFCNKCGAGYITIAALRKHGKTHENGHFPCEYCEKIYTSMSKKKQHVKGVHTGGWFRNKCPHCPEIFVSYYDRSEHMSQVHNETPLVYPCNACDKVYKKKFELNRHIRHHHLQQRNYKCDFCNAKFFSKRGLLDHVSRHNGRLEYTCHICGKVFSRSRTLKDHISTAHGEGKKYQCETCNKCFVQKSTLRNHIRLHQGDLDIFKEFDDVKHLIDDREITLKQIAIENRQRERDDNCTSDLMIL